jgi:hypothetical protein
MEEFAKFVGKTPSELEDIFSGRTRVSDSELQRLAGQFGSYFGCRVPIVANNETSLRAFGDVVGRLAQDREIQKLASSAGKTADEVRNMLEGRTTLTPDMILASARYFRVSIEDLMK